jgi:carbonic anhydrase
MWFTKTYGDDHLCLTEIEFYDKSGMRLTASLVSMSSCYGCSTCDGCTHRYGNPQALFDGDSNSSNASSWICTAPGTFDADGIGSQNVVFMLSGHPQFYVLQRPQVNGDWVTRDWTMEMEEDHAAKDLFERWITIDIVEDFPKRPDQTQNITMMPTPVVAPSPPVNPPWSYATPEQWVMDYPKCAGFFQSPINLELIAEMSAEMRGNATLPFVHQPLTRRALANTGKGLQVAAGKLGTLTLWDGTYRTKQFNFHFPAEHTIDGDDHLAMGELQIVFQREGAKYPTDGLAIVSIMLHLPLEHELLKEEEKWFIDMGLLAIPNPGEYSMPLAKPIDFSILNHVFEGNFWHYTGSLTTPPCTEGVQYFVMERFALVSGVVIEQFKAKFPGPMTARPVQKLNARPVFVNQLPTPPVEEEI